MNWPERLWARVRGDLDLGRLGLADLEHAAEHLVHGEERGRHAAAGLEKAAPVEPLARAVSVGQLLDARLDLLLLRGLRDRRELAVGDHPGRHRRAEGGILSTFGPRQIFLAQKNAHHEPPVLKPSRRSANSWRPCLRVAGHVADVARKAAGLQLRRDPWGPFFRARPALGTPGHAKGRSRWRPARHGGVPASCRLGPGRPRMVPILAGRQRTTRPRGLVSERPGRAGRASSGSVLPGQ